MTNQRTRRKSIDPSVSWSIPIDRCPHCGRGLTGHSYSLLASDVIDRNEGSHRLIEFFDSLKSHDWGKLLTFQRWEGLADNVVLYGIRCGSDSLVLVAVRSPFELYDNDEILTIEALGEDDTKDLLELAKDKDWKAID